MTFEQALAHSFERLLLMAQAKRKCRASETLHLAQLIVVGINGKPEDWRDMQREIIDEINRESE